MRRAIPVLFLLAAACGSAGSTLAKKHDGKYVGAGSVWEWDLNADGTFSASHKASQTATDALMTIAGTYEAFPTGFYRFTVGTTTGDGAPAAGEQAYGFGVAGVILFVKPTGDNSEIMPMPAVGACPTAAHEFNWLQANGSQEQGDLTTHDFWGNATLPLTGDITGKAFLLDGTVGEPRTFSTVGACSDGFIAIGNEGFMTMTQAGVGILDAGESKIVAVPRDTTVSAATLAGKEFVGLVFMEKDSGSETQPLNVSFPASGAGTYTMLSDVTKLGATKESGPLTVLEAGAGDKAGFLKLEANSGQEKKPVMWAATVADLGGSGHTFFFATGFNTPGNTEVFSVIAIQK